MENRIDEAEIVNEAINSLLDIKKKSKFMDESELIAYSQEHLKLIYPIHYPISMPLTIYRTRAKKKINASEDMTSPSIFSFVPILLNRDKLPIRGRLNLTGQSVFYSSISPSTNLKEMKDEICEGDIVYISQWDIHEDAQFSLYNVIAPDNITMSTNNKENQLVIDDPHIVNGPIGKYLKYLGKLLLEKEENGAYITTSLLANKILFGTNGSLRRNDNQMSVHYDGIVYPSAVGDFGELNIAFKPEFIDENFSLKYVYEGVVKNQYVEIDFSRVGICSENKIKWYELWIWEDDIQIDSYSFFDKKGEIPFSDNYNIFFKGEKIDDFEKVILKYFSVKCLIEKNFFKDNCSFGNIEEVLKNKSKPYFIKCDDCRIDSENHSYEITDIGIFVNYHTSLKEIDEIEIG